MMHWYKENDTQRALIIIIIIIISSSIFICPPASLLPVLMYDCRVGAKPSYPTLTRLRDYTYDPQVVIP
jgi:hypothetical protein